ncbi:hypothetical protein BD560DRAFT_474116 [Blakeslea trispora]|nr:hypothetical protein BD560DRAFT_474116 [Blakeslea trispora]
MLFYEKLSSYNDINHSQILGIVSNLNADYFYRTQFWIYSAFFLYNVTSLVKTCDTQAEAISFESMGRKKAKTPTNLTCHYLLFLPLINHRTSHHEEFVLEKYNLEHHKKRVKKACRRESMLSFEEQQQKDAKFYQMYLKDQASKLPLQCLCPDKRMPKSTLNFLDSVQKVNVELCSCSPLTKQLISNQLMPASFQSPKTAIHFAMMDYFHLLKMNAYVSNHFFARISNQMYQKTGASSADEFPLTKLIVNNLHFLYRRLLLFVQHNVNKKYNLNTAD